ncbi:MAG TPA: hypothetical protein VM677_06865 [Actinokineospora sp.]|nr:hypothetical protein [Actinokineospora sp.]
MLKLLDRVLESLLPQDTAGACVAPDCQYYAAPSVGRSGGQCWCCYRCDGSLYCPGTYVC